jgi:competence protein ComEC
VSIPVSAAIACQPIILIFSSSIPTYGVIANVLAEPFVPLATITGLLSILATPVPPLSDGLLAIASLAAGAIAFVARTFAAFPVARIPWPHGTDGITIDLHWSDGTRTRIAALPTGLWKRIDA